jgi:hypothetical protein
MADIKAALNRLPSPVAGTSAGNWLGVSGGSDGHCAIGDAPESIDGHRAIGDI